MPDWAEIACWAYPTPAVNAPASRAEIDSRMELCIQSTCIDSSTLQGAKQSAAWSHMIWKYSPGVRAVSGVDPCISGQFGNQPPFGLRVREVPLNISLRTRRMYWE